MLSEAKSCPAGSKNIFKSIGAFVAGLAVTFALSYGTDYLLRLVGVLPKENIYVASFIIVAVILYRSVYNVIGGYTVARLAPNRAVSHAMVIGVLGTIGSLGGAIATWNLHVGPHWYPLMLAALSLPAAWYGGTLSLRRGGRVAVSENVLQTQD